MAENASGRHRAPGRFNPLNEISAIVSATAQPAVKTSAVLAMSGGLVAAFAVPAQAAAEVEAPAATVEVAAAPATLTAGAMPVAPTSFGLAGFTAKAKPPPPPPPPPPPVVVEVRQDVATPVSRSTNRTTTTTTTTTSAATSTKAPATSYPVKPAAGGVLSIAAQYVGLGYSYGGTSPSTGFDCSGYTQFVFRQVGISLPRTAEAQRQAATQVSNPQPGDLVFFGAPAYHVGIYAGGGMLYDSPGTGKSVSKRSIWTGAVTYGRP